MTAEVGVLNSIGVALAADSAVSIGREAEKIYTSADKIFQLSCSAPIGAMIFGNAGLAGLPWETIIKVYRAQLGEKRFGTITEYGEDFLGFLGRDHGMFLREAQDRHTGLLVAGLLLELAEVVTQSRLTLERKQGTPLQDDVGAQLLDDWAQRYLDEVQGHEFLVGFSATDFQPIETRYGQAINEIIKEVFDGLPIEPATHAKLRALAVQALARDVPGNLRSGLVIAGFGEQEYLPGLVHYRIEGSALDRLRYVQRDVSRVDSDTSALVVPFAQQEMVHSFMEGIDRQLLEFIEASTRTLFSGAVEEIVKLATQADQKVGKALQKKIGPNVPGLVDTLLKGWEKKRREFWEPVLSITASLPKDELAAMAEALVNLTKFRRRVTTARETVGGPIDVALITKGDGFVWVKRKHYFDPDLNPRVIARYQQGG